MSATLQLDTIQNGGVNIQFEQGVASTATRQGIVTGLTTTTQNGQIAEVVALLAANSCSYGTAFPGNSNLVVKNVSIRTLDGSNNKKAAVTIEYVRVGDDDGSFVFHGSSAVSQETTNSDANGNPIVLSYTYPSGYWNSQLAGTTSSQRPQIPVMLPENTLYATGILQTTDPVGIQRKWSGYTNSDTWFGEKPNHWIVTQVNWEPFDLSASPPKYKFTFEFQCRRRGFVQTAYFEDETGHTPSNVVYGTGYKRIVVQGYRAFSELFPE